MLKWNKKKDGIVVALAWPETYCKQTSAWYDRLMKYTRFNRNGYYQVGHAALLVIKKGDNEVHYYDFGRYHAPEGKGRVRSAETDFDLAIKTDARWSETGRLLNLNEIIFELEGNSSCHGDGVITYSSTEVNYNLVHQKITDLQEKVFIPYGPFVWRGTNCSRFVRTAILAGSPCWRTTLRLKFPLMITPTPMWNVRSLMSKKTVWKHREINWIENFKLNN